MLSSDNVVHIYKKKEYSIRLNNTYEYGTTNN